MIERTTEAGIHTIRLDHGKANALDAELMQALREAMQQARDASALVITGSGPIFCAGVDLPRLLNAGSDYANEFVPMLSAFLRELFEFPAPVVVAANGHAIAGGALILMAADYRIMADGNGRFGVTELLVGVPFPTIALEVVRFAVPRDQLQSLIYSGKTVTAREALQARLIDEVAPPDQLDTRAQAVARQLARLPADVFRATKRALRAPTLEYADRIGAHADAETQRIWASSDTHQRIRDYLDSIRRK